MSPTLCATAASEDNTPGLVVFSSWLSQGVFLPKDVGVGHRVHRVRGGLRDHSLRAGWCPLPPKPAEGEVEATGAFLSLREEQPSAPC